jgi:uncharacterized membrane protein YphA (DoxX/SURF4 family)
MKALLFLTSYVDVVGLIACVAVGYKTKLAAFVLSVTLLLGNVFFHAFWMASSPYTHDVLR